MGMNLCEAMEKETSAQLQLEAYYNLRTARELVAASLLQGKMEYRLYIKRVKKAVEDRNRNKDGKLYDAIDIRDMEQKLILWVSATTKQLRALSGYEVEMLGIISSRGLFPDEEGLEALNYASQ